ncbi:transcription factor Ouib [Paramuricea clavata]|uniref:Transcription factor Ouib n=1 Tax=Paramuricea clavata TaxID=317549 RepID=A0A6S7L027_PARCT|nr:transcription factor Ouib [Paramuricea clavata]
MASKGTPKKLYKKRSELTVSISRCRLCNCVCDPQHSKNLFGKQNQPVLCNAKFIYGGKLPQDINLPHLVCAPCERRLNNAIQLKNTISETQRVLQETICTKRCVEILPSVSRQFAGTSCRRSIDFNISGSQSESVSPTPLALHVSIF